MLVSDLHESIRLHVLATIKSRQLTQHALAERIGVKQAHISNFLLGRRGLSIEAMDGILKVLGLNVEQLVSCPGDLVSMDSSLGIGVGPAEGTGLLLVGANVAPEFAGQICH